jgi:ferrochelatase
MTNIQTKTLIILVQLGTPKNLSVSAIRVFLKKFLMDPRVVDWDSIFWKLILNLFILPTRPKKLLKLYEKIYLTDQQDFPLTHFTLSFSEKLQTQINKMGLKEKVTIKPCFLIPESNWKELLDFATANQFDKVLIWPQFPQYSEATSASVVDSLYVELKNRVVIPRFEFIQHFCALDSFIQQSVALILQTLRQVQTPNVHLILSFHGLPTRRVTEKKDPYFFHCQITSQKIQALLKAKIAELNLQKSQDLHFDSLNISTTFQSRFGSEEWLKPATDEWTLNVVKKYNEKNALAPAPEQSPLSVVVYAPSFTVDCLETLEELGVQLREEVEQLQGHYFQVPCLNDGDIWVESFSQDVKSFLEGKEILSLNHIPEIKSPAPLLTEIREQGSISITTENFNLQNPQTHSAPESENSPLNPEFPPKIQKSIFKNLFLILFLDLIGFTIIFPLFPALAQYYIEQDPNNFFLKGIFSLIATINPDSMGDNPLGSFQTIVLFGGILGAVYSLLQFLFAPFWGSLSDKIGRRPILIISMMGILVGHGLWFFAGNFTILLLARLIGGLMSGNISTATAVMADITSPQTRSRGMAFVGIAFALGFIIGPAMGGILSLVNFSVLFPQLSVYGVNPFSAPALLSFVLTFINITFLLRNFPETLPKLRWKNVKGQEKSTEGAPSTSAHTERSINPFKLFHLWPYAGVNLTNFGHFFFLTLFAGMEFTLTFLAVERLGFTSLQNAWMFIYIGFWIVMIQGGVVRRYANRVGEKNLAQLGLTLLIPGLLITAWASSVPTLYLGLTFLSVGSALVIPCLTALISLYTPPEKQGSVIGVFRSLGALGRVIGPLSSALLYWRFGPSFPYLLGALLMLIPLFMVSKLPTPVKN